MTINEVKKILTNIRYKDWEFHVGDDYVQVRFLARCAKTGVHEWQSGRKWRISEHMTKSELVQTVFKAVVTAEEHEARENFFYRSRPIFGPHYDVDVLHAVAEERNEDTRPEIRQ